MSTFDIVREVDCSMSFRVKQLQSMFDLPVTHKLRHHWKVDLPVEEEWRIGLIVGPSGSGKSVIAREAFPGRVHEHFAWPTDRAILDGFPKSATTSDCVAALNAVGFSSPPSWCKPFRVLSTGEQFRAEIARAMIEYGDWPVIVIDEFTSVVDRLVAKVISSATAKAVRRRNLRMVAVSCHYDIQSWLEPDWILDMKTQRLSRRRLRRPRIDLRLYESGRTAWYVFAPHHYLSSDLHRASRCFVTRWDHDIVAFAAVLPSMGHTGLYRIHRIVVLPDYQGIGVGRATLSMIGEFYKILDKRLTITSSHPAMIHGLRRDPTWRIAAFYPHGAVQGTRTMRRRASRDRAMMATFNYVGQT